MDRRKRKTRDAIFKAFIELLSQKDFANITVGEIIDRADIGRATFYAHFETKDFLLKEMCEELFCHLFDTATGQNDHHHIFDCDAHDSVFLHLFKHLEKNDNKILDLLSSDNNQLFLNYFKSELLSLVENQLDEFKKERFVDLPHEFLVNHIASTFVETVKWWTHTKQKISAQEIASYFFSVI